MAVDWVIDYECEAKRRLTTEGLIACLKAQGRAETLIPLMRADDPNKPIEEMVVEQMMLTPDGVEVLAREYLRVRHVTGLHDRRAEPSGADGFGEPLWLVSRRGLPGEPITHVQDADAAKLASHDAQIVRLGERQAFACEADLPGHVVNAHLQVGVVAVDEHAAGRGHLPCAGSTRLEAKR